MILFFLKKPQKIILQTNNSVNNFMFIETLLRFERHFRPVISSILPFHFNTLFYSNARKLFINFFVNSKLKEHFILSNSQIKLWNIDFNCSLFNAAGMFKNAEGYYVCAKMGAGAFLAGTTTYNSRIGNSKCLVKHPFITYPNSYVSSNW